MKPVESAEISAFLDGELSSARASEVEAALKADSALRAEFNALARMDAAWRSVASTSVFAPKVKLARNARLVRPWLGTAAILIVLVAVRILPKLTDALEFGFVLHGIGLVIVLAWVIRMTRGAAIAMTAPSS
jgi:anti-sigma factor RsiW